MRRYLSMIVIAIMLAVWIPIAMSGWMVVGPWRLMGTMTELDDIREELAEAREVVTWDY